MAIGFGHGGMGFLEDGAAALFRFDEPDAGVQPQDEIGNLHGLIAVGATTPTAVDAIIGLGRLFAADVGFKAAELVAGSLLLRRTLSIEAILSLDTAKLTNGTRTICARGLSGTAAERRLFGLQVVTTGAPGAPVLTLQMFWQKAGGTNATVAGVVIAPPAGYCVVSAVRRWTSTTVVEVDYFLNELLIGTVTATEGDIADGVAGTFTVGCRGDGAGGFENFFVDAIDELRISTVPRTPEEVRQTYRQIMLYPAQVLEAMRASGPTGQAYSRDPTSAIQRELAVEADILGIAFGLAQELRDDFLPDRATRELEHWEAVTRLAPRAADSIAMRRLRVVTFLRKVFGFNRDQIREALFEILAVDQPSRLKIIERLNRQDDLFIEVSTPWLQNESRKLGAMYTPGGGAGAANEQTITAAAQSIGPLARGTYRIAGTSDFYVCQGKQSVITALTALEIAKAGVRIPAGAEVDFHVDPAKTDDWIAWVRVAADGTLRLNGASGVLSLAWMLEPFDGTIFRGPGYLTLAYGTTGDARWTGAIRRAPSLRRAVGGELVADVDHVGSDAAFEIRMLVSASALGSNGDRLGIFVFDQVTGDAHLFAVEKQATPRWSVNKLETEVDHITTFTTPAVPAVPYYLRVLLPRGGQPGSFGVATDGWDGPWTEITPITAPTIARPWWCGPFIAPAAAPAGVAGSMTIGGFRTWAPFSRDVFQWYVWRDPGLPGVPDLLGAQLALEKQKPAHTRGYVCQSTVFSCDDPRSLCDRDALGG